MPEETMVADQSVDVGDQKDGARTVVEPSEGEKATQQTNAVSREEHERLKESLEKANDLFRRTQAERDAAKSESERLRNEHLDKLTEIVVDRKAKDSSEGNIAKIKARITKALESGGDEGAEELVGVLSQLVRENDSNTKTVAEQIRAELRAEYEGKLSQVNERLQKYDPRMRGREAQIEAIKAAMPEVSIDQALKLVDALKLGPRQPETPVPQGTTAGTAVIASDEVKGPSEQEAAQISAVLKMATPNRGPVTKEEIAKHWRKK